MKHAADAVESVVPQRYHDEHCSKGKHDKDIKTADIWQHGGDAMNAAADVTMGGRYGRARDARR